MRYYGTRRKPLFFYSLQRAIDFAKDRQSVIWCVVEDYADLFHIYPGGRIERRNRTAETRIAKRSVVEKR